MIYDSYAYVALLREIKKNKKMIYTCCIYSVYLNLIHSGQVTYGIKNILHNIIYIINYTISHIWTHQILIISTMLYIAHYIILYNYNRTSILDLS